MGTGLGAPPTPSEEQALQRLVPRVDEGVQGRSRQSPTMNPESPEGRF